MTATAFIKNKDTRVRMIADQKCRLLIPLSRKKKSVNICITSQNLSTSKIDFPPSSAPKIPGTAFRLRL